jgi:uncharacterized protein
LTTENLPDPTGPRVVRLYRYPVKGLSAEPLRAVALAAGEAVPGDRMFALARPDTVFDEHRPEPLPKTRFLMLQKDEALARVRSAYDPDTRTLVLDPSEAGGRRVVANLSTADGLDDVERFFAGLLRAKLGGRRPRLVAALDGHRFTDAGPDGPELMRAVSMVNLASVRDLAERVGRPVHHLRFRANVYVDGIPAWAERDWVDREIGLGPVRARVLARIPRCAATTVNPDTGERDIRLLKELATHYGHEECGCYLAVTSSGTVRPSDPVTPPA